MTCIVGRVLTPEVEMPRAAITVKGEQIVGVEPVESAPSSAIVVDDGWIVPGFIDLQVVGAFGQDFADPQMDPRPVAAGLITCGVTAYLPTVVTSPLNAYPALFGSVRRAMSSPGAAALGVHLEGPYLQPKRCGAHQAEYLRLPNEEEIASFIGSGILRALTLAPELPGAKRAISQLREADILVGLGHTDATFAKTITAIRIGAGMGTHTFNAMRPIHQREPGVIGALLTDRRPRAGLIADGIHVHPALLKLAFWSKGADGIVLVSDSMAAAGMPPGRYSLGGQEVETDGVSARLPDGTLAGSVLTLDRAVANLVYWGDISVREAVQMATLSPARALGIDHERGEIAPGHRADLVVLDPDLRVRATIVGGRIAWGCLNN